MSFTLFDIIIITIIITSTLLGLAKGIIKLGINLTGFLGSIFAAYFIYPLAHNFLTEHFTNELVIVILSGIVSYIISIIFFSLLMNKFLNLIKGITGGIVDRFLGLLAGFVRGGVICLLVFSTAAVLGSGSYIEARNLEDVAHNTTKDKYPEWLKYSLTMEYLDNFFKNIIILLPQDTLKTIKIPQSDKNEKALENSTEMLKKASKMKKYSKDTGSQINEDLKEELDSVFSSPITHD